MKVIVKNADETWALSSRSHLEGLSLSEVKHPVSQWPGELGGNQLSTQKWIGLLGGVEEWLGETNTLIPSTVEGDDLWRIKPAALLEQLISACYMAETKDINRQWDEANRDPNSRAGSEIWPTKEFRSGDRNIFAPKTSWDRFRTGRCETKRGGAEPQRCGSPREKFDSVIRNVAGLNKTKCFLVNLASGTQTSYWGRGTSGRTSLKGGNVAV